MNIMHGRPYDAPDHPRSLVDGCENCVENVEPPRSVTPLTDGYRCAYLCADCGHAWTTDWTD